MAPATEDGSNGYEAVANIYIAGRGSRSRVGDSIGASVVKVWANAFPPGATVLDLGSGPGEPSTRILQEASLTTYAVDASPTMVVAQRGSMKDGVNAERLTDVPAILAHWDIPPITAIAAIRAGTSMFKITTTGPTFILKDISNAPDLHRLTFTRSVLTHVARTGLRVPLPLLTRMAQPAVSFQGRFYRLAEWIEADSTPPDSVWQAEVFYHTGQAMATLHHALASYAAMDVSCQTWREQLVIGIATWIPALVKGLPAPQAAVITRVREERGAAIATTLSGLPEQLIHRDCHPGNILVQGTQVVGFIDCDHFCIGHRVFDLAYYAVHHLKWVIDDPVATQRWLSNLPQLLNGYGSVQPLSAAERAAFPAAMLAYHLLLAYYFMGQPEPQPQSMMVEVRALDWIHRHFDVIVSATTAN